MRGKASEKRKLLQIIVKCSEENKINIIVRKIKEKIVYNKKKIQRKVTLFQKDKIRENKKYEEETKKVIKNFDKNKKIANEKKLQYLHKMEK